MTDVRKCDGPDCDHEAPLNDDVAISLNHMPADHFIVLEQGYPKPTKHFHTDNCMRDWVRKNVK